MVHTRDSQTFLGPHLPFLIDLASRKVINYYNLLERHGNLLKTLSKAFYCKQIHISGLLNNFL
jgi:hypothetical protein